MATEEPLEDRLWDLPPDFAAWINNINSIWNFPTPGVNAENVHLVFAASPFCAAESANKRFEALVNRKPELQPRFFNRRQYEAELREFPGESYVIIDGPEKSSEGMNLIWVVERRFTTIDRTARSEEDRYSIEVRGHYVVVADRIFAAPTLMEVLQARWVSHVLQTASSRRRCNMLMNE
jgi:hypothetical protein